MFLVSSFGALHSRNNDVHYYGENFLTIFFFLGIP